MEMVQGLVAALQSGFQSLRLPPNIITHSLLTRVEGQYHKYLYLMVISMAAESNNIFKDLLKLIEEQTDKAWFVCDKIEAAADRINNSKNSVTKKKS
jgi:hypothetical protein